ncbi:MAG: hydroxymethylglutaryl-CoA lyase, partial [Crocinitomicaceae bacterium]
YNAGCRRYDGAVRGFGGCPMATDELTGNMPTEKMLSWFDENEIRTGIDPVTLDKAMQQALSVFP